MDDKHLDEKFFSLLQIWHVLLCINQENLQQDISNFKSNEQKSQRLGLLFSRLIYIRIRKNKFNYMNPKSV